MRDYLPFSEIGIIRYPTKLFSQNHCFGNDVHDYSKTKERIDLRRGETHVEHYGVQESVTKALSRTL